MSFGGVALGGCALVAALAAEVARETGLADAAIPLLKAAYLLKEFYVEPIDPQLAKQRLLAGLLDNLDPHTAYLPPERSKRMAEEMQGSYGGVGMGAKAGAEKGVLVVTDVSGEGPAARAGIKPGDRILAIDGAPVDDRGWARNAGRIRGPVGSIVELKMAPKEGGAARVARLARAPIELPIAQWTLIDTERGKVLWLRESRFGEDLVRQTATAAMAANKEAGGKVVGILLDLRDNGGGLVSSAVGLAAFFGEPGALVVTARGREGQAAQRWSATLDDWSVGQNLGEDHVATARKAAPWLGSAPMAVLVNRRSASASEIVAGALRDWKRAVVVGNDTFGKGSVQSLIPLGEGNGSIKITTSRYYTPLGSAIQAVGVKVDVKVASALDRGLREADLPKHLARESAGAEPNPATEAAEGEELSQDSRIAAELAREESRATFSWRLRAPGGDPYVAAGVRALKL